MIRIVLMLAAAIEAAAQVQVQATPEPMAVLKSLHIRDVGVWTISACQDGPAAITLPRERLTMAFPQVHWIEPNLALNILTTRQAQSKPAIIVNLLEAGLLIGATIGGAGSISMSRELIGYLAAGAGVAHVVHDRVQSQIPAITPFTDSLLRDPVTLAPGACDTRVAFAGKMKNPQSYATVIK